MKRRWPDLPPDVEEVYLYNGSIPPRPPPKRPKPIPMPTTPDPIVRDDGMSERAATMMCIGLTILLIVAFVFGLLGDRL